MTQRAIASSYRANFGWEMPTMKLARIMYSERPLDFRNLEGARSALSSIEGKRNRVTDKKYERIPDRVRNPYKLPQSFETTYEPYVIKGKKVGILSDIHLPYHNISALTAAIKHLEEYKPDVILLNGDTMDCHRLSKFVKEPDSRNFQQELDSLKIFMESLDRVFPNAKKIFKMGNHEERYEMFLKEKMYELEGIKEFQFENILKSRSLGVEFVTDKRLLYLNKLVGVHGHEFTGGAFGPVNIARGLFNKAKCSSFQGHNHQTSEHSEPTLTGKLITTYSIGCLCELHPRYMRINKWNHGFATVDLDKNGIEYEFRNYRILNGKVL